MRLYRIRNREKIREMGKLWVKNNKDKVKESQARYVKKNKENKASSDARWRSKNLDRVREYLAKYYASHREEIKAKSSLRHSNNKSNPSYIRKRKAAKQSWNARNPHKCLEYVNKRRARLAGAITPKTPLVFDWYESWKSKKNARCFWCNKKFNTKHCHADHIVPLSKGGKHEIENLCISCSTCNTRKATKSIQRWNSEISQPVLL